MSLAVLLALVLAPAPAHAWTSATVRTAQAHLTIGSDGRAEVTLVAEVHVAGGWLEGFEIDGLDPALELVPERPATFEDALGTSLAPSFEHRGDGRVVWSFRRRDAPRRGDYAATVTYRAPLGIELRSGDRARLSWTLPAWRNGLDDVAITIDGPAGAEPILAEGDEASVAVERVELEHGERVVLRRVHLPRTREWPIVLEVPASALDPALRAPRAVVAPPAPRVRADEPARPLPALFLVIVLAALALARIGFAPSLDRGARVITPPLVPLPAPARAGAILLAAIAACAHDAAWAPAAVAIAILALDRRAGAPRAPRLGAFRPAGAAELARARRAALAERAFPLALGAAALAAPVVAVAAPIEGLSTERSALIASLASALLLDAARRARPPSVLADLGALAELAARTRAALDPARAWAMRLVVHADVRGELQDARLRIVPSAAPKGLLRLDVVRVARAERGRWASELALLVVAREGSAVDRALGSLPELERAPRRVARAVPIHGSIAATLAPLLDALAACPIEPSAIPAPTELAATG